MEHVHSADMERVHTSLQLYFEKKPGKWQDEYRFRCADGTYKEVFDRGYALFNGDDKPYRMIGAMTDLTEKRSWKRNWCHSNFNCKNG